MNPATIVFFGYLFVLMGLALWSRRDTGSLKGYYLADKKLPFWVVAFSTNATGESGWLLLGLTGMGYAVGAQAYWVVVGEVLGVWLSWTLVSRRLKRKSDEHNAITVPDVLSSHFLDRRNILRWLSIFIILTMACAYVSAQMVASGKAFGSFMNLPYLQAVILGAVVIIVYTWVGGYKAVAYSDVVQGVLMLLGLVLVPLIAINQAGGWGQVLDKLQQIDPTLINISSITDSGLPGWIALVSFLAIGLPFLGVPQLMVRFMSAKDEHELAKARWVSVLVILLFDIGAVTAGMAGRALYPELSDPETIFPTLAQDLFPALITGVLMIVVLSAIMSTVDSLLLLASSAVVRDLLQKTLGSKKSDRELTTVAKTVTLVVGVLGLLFALSEVKLIFWFVLFAWSGLGAAFGPVILCMLFFKRTTLAGAVAGMMTGFGVSIIWVLLPSSMSYDLYEMVPGFFLGLLVTISVSLVTQNRKRV